MLKKAARDAFRLHETRSDGGKLCQEYLSEVLDRGLRQYYYLVNIASFGNNANSQTDQGFN